MAKQNTTLRIEPGMLEIIGALAEHDGRTTSALIEDATQQKVLRIIEADPVAADIAREVAQSYLNEHLLAMAKTFGSAVVESLVMPEISELAGDKLS